MENNKQDKFERARTRLSSLQRIIAQMTEYSVEEKFVREFHAVLDRLEGIGMEVAEYRIPDSEVKPKVTGVSAVSYIGGGESHVSYSKEKYVAKAFILTKIDAILGYFEIITSEKPRRIGFSPPDTNKHGKGGDMATNNQDIFTRAYTMLTSLRTNIDKMTALIPETYVHEFHVVLDKLESIGKDVAEFRIPDSEVKPKVTGVSAVSYIGGGESHVSYSGEKYVDQSFILTKLDAILGYFEIITSKKPRRIGFSPPDTT